MLTKIKCFKCHGTGQLTYERINLIRFHVDEVVDCNACDGKGWIYD